MLISTGISYRLKTDFDWLARDAYFTESTLQNFYLNYISIKIYIIKKLFNTIITFQPLLQNNEIKQLQHICLFSETVQNFASFFSFYRLSKNFEKIQVLYTFIVLTTEHFILVFYYVLALSIYQMFNQLSKKKQMSEVIKRLMFIEKNVKCINLPYLRHPWFSKASDIFSKNLQFHRHTYSSTLK